MANKTVMIEQGVENVLEQKVKIISILYRKRFHFFCFYSIMDLY